MAEEGIKEQPFTDEEFVEYILCGNPDDLCADIIIHNGRDKGCLVEMFCVQQLGYAREDVACGFVLLNIKGVTYELSGFMQACVRFFMLSRKKDKLTFREMQDWLLKKKGE